MQRSREFVLRQRCKRLGKEASLVKRLTSTNKKAKWVRIMVELLKIIHFLSFSVAIGAGVANLTLGARLASFPPEVMPTLGGFRLFLGKLSTIGLILLWVTGLLMIAATNGAVTLDSVAFLLKLAAVMVLTGFSVLANLTVAQAKKAGTPPDATRMKNLAVGSQAMAVLAVILAVVAFG